MIICLLEDAIIPYFNKFFCRFFRISCKTYDSDPVQRIPTRRSQWPKTLSAVEANAVSCSFLLTACPTTEKTLKMLLVSCKDMRKL